MPFNVDICPKLFGNSLWGGRFRRHYPQLNEYLPSSKRPEFVRFALPLAMQYPDSEEVFRLEESMRNDLAVALRTYQESHTEEGRATYLKLLAEFAEMAMGPTAALLSGSAKCILRIR